jgi:hypothetical protein
MSTMNIVAVIIIAVVLVGGGALDNGQDNRTSQAVSARSASD